MTAYAVETKAAKSDEWTTDMLVSDKVIALELALVFINEFAVRVIECQVSGDDVTIYYRGPQ